MPWTLSTCPVTTAGKARVARNGWKGDVRAKVSNWHRTVSQIVLNVEKLYSLVRPKRKKHPFARVGPVLSTVSPVFAWDVTAGEEEEDDEMDAVDRMSSAEVQAALSRYARWKPFPADYILQSR